MQGTVMYGPRNVRCEERPDPTITREVKHTCEHCAKPLKRPRKRFCSRACITAHRQQTIKLVWVVHFIRERGTTTWHRPSLNLSHKSLCGANIADEEEIMVEAANVLIASELCAECEALFVEESHHRLAQVYGILLGLANSRRQRLSTPN